VANAVRRGRCSEVHAGESLVRLGRLPIDADEATVAHAWTHTQQLARVENLSLNDAAYLEPALRHSLPLASCDQALVAAAQRRQLRVL
jgi:predicted nucleic acid-binding protein